MKVRLAKFSPFTAPGILFAAEGETGGGTTDAVTDTTSVDDPAEVDDKAGSTDADALGDKGKKALDAMKAERAAARAETKTLRDEVAALKAKAEGKEAEHAAAQQSQKVRDDALAAADVRILKAEIRAAAAGKLTDPADALLYLDLSVFEVGTDGEVDGKAIAAAITDLIGKKPYLSAQGGKRFQGDADGGTRKESSKSIDDQIAAATAAGNFQLVIALKQQRASLASKS